MKRAMILAAFLAVFLSLAGPASAQYNTYASPPAELGTASYRLPTGVNVPLIRGIPPLFLTTVVGAGTATRFLDPIPLVWDPITHELYASGAPLIVRVGLASVTMTASGQIDVRISSLTVPITATATIDQTTPGTTNAVAPKVTDGSTWFPFRGTASGAFFIPQPVATGTCEVLTTGLVATNIPVTPNRYTVTIFNIGTETVWVRPWSDTASPSFPSGGIPLLQYDALPLPYGPEVDDIGYVSSSPGTIVVLQGVRR